MKSTALLSIMVAAVLICGSLSAAPKAVLSPFGTESKKDRKKAEKIEEKIRRTLGASEDVSLVKLGKKESDKAIGCEFDQDCIFKAVSKVSADLYVVPLMKTNDDDELLIKIYYYDESGDELDTDKVKTDDSDEAAEKVAGKIEKYAAKMKKSEKKKKARDEEEESEPVVKKAPKTYDEEPAEAEEEEGSGSLREGLELYKDGDLKQSADFFYKAGKKDATAKKLYEAVKDVAELKKRAAELMAQQKLDEAAEVIDEAEKKDIALRTIGNQKGVFSKENIRRVLYEDPSKQDFSVVDKIHQKFVKKIEETRQNRVKQLAEIDKELNAKIMQREEKIKAMIAAEADQVKKEKDSEGELKKRIADMKYKWEKEDGELEQQIVALESKLTMLEQREKGVVKVSTDKRDQEKQKEFDDVDKKYQEARKKLNAEKESFNKGDKELMTKGGEKVEKEVAALLKQKKEKEDKIVELDKKIQAALEEFDKAERAKGGENESVKMKNEDEDRKFNVEIEKEYQKKFDELNKKLAEYDAKESEKREALAKFDKEIEEFFMKNAEEMGKIQEGVDKERVVVEKEYNDKKATSQADSEAKYKAKADELAAKKTELETKLAAFNDETEKLKKDKETELTAANKQADIKKEQDKIEKARKAEKPKMEKELKTVTAEIAKHEKNKDQFIAEALMALDEAYMPKMDAFDMKVATENQRLQKVNEEFKKKKTEEKKKFDAEFQKFLKEKEMYKKNIDKMVEAAQKDRDAKMAKRRDDRDKLSKGWGEDSKKRKETLDRRLEPDRSMKDRLTKEIEEITMKVEQINGKWAKEQETMNEKQKEKGDKFDKDWKARSEALENDYTAKKEAVTKKYEQIEIDEKNSNKDKKQKLEVEIDKLLAEKNRRKESRQVVLNQEKDNWEAQKKKWVEEKAKRKTDLEQFKAANEEELKAEKKKVSEKKRAVDEKYEEELKKVNEEELQQIQAKFSDDYKDVSKLELAFSGITKEIEALKSEILAKQGLTALRKEDLISARRSFVQALYLNRDNKTAEDGLKSITNSAKAIYWKAYGMRDTNKAEAKRIFESLIKTLMPSNEYFIKAKTALEEVK